MAKRPASLKNKRGSALVWSVIVLAVMVIFVGAAIAIAQSYHARSLHYSSYERAWLTARSAAQTTGDLLVAGELDNLVPAVGQTTENVPFTVNAGEPNGFGDCTLSFAHDSESRLTVTATAVYGGQNATFATTLARNYAEVLGFGRGLYVKNAADLARVTAVTGDLCTEASGSLAVSAQISGSLFAPNANVIVTAGGYVRGTIVAQSVSYGNTNILPAQVVCTGKTTGSVPSDRVITAAATDFAAAFSGTRSPALFSDYKESGFNSALPVNSDTTENAPYKIKAGTYNALTGTGAQDLWLQGTGSGNQGTAYLLISGLDVTLQGAKLDNSINLCVILRDGATLTDMVSAKKGQFSVICADSSDCSYIVGADKLTVTGNIFVPALGFLPGCDELTVAGVDTGNLTPSYLLPHGWRLAKYEEGAQ